MSTMVGDSMSDAMEHAMIMPWFLPALDHTIGCRMEQGMGQGIAHAMSDAMGPVYHG